MPIVRVKLIEHHDEETKARLARELAAAVAEATVNSIADVHVLIDENERENQRLGLADGRATRSDDVTRADYASLSYIEYSPETEEEYLELRRDVINPGMATQDGFVGSLLLRRHDRDHEYLLLNRWVCEEDDRRYSSSALHDGLKGQALRLLPRPLVNVATDIVHLDPPAA